MLEHSLRVHIGFSMYGHGGLWVLHTRRGGKRRPGAVVCGEMNRSILLDALVQSERRRRDCYGEMDL